MHNTSFSAPENEPIKIHSSLIPKTRNVPSLTKMEFTMYFHTQHLLQIYPSTDQLTSLRYEKMATFESFCFQMMKLHTIINTLFTSHTIQDD